MSDFSIPGTGTDKYGTKDIVKALMDVERARRLEPYQAELKRSKQEREVWQDLNADLSKVREAASALFSFQNPFQEKIAASSDEKVLTATATRTAGDESRDIEVRRLAAADRLISRPIDRSFRAEAGRYAFRVGDREVAFTYAGGGINDFVEALNRRVGTDVRASLLKDTKDTQVLLIESLRTGADNKLQFRDKARDLAVAVGLIVPDDEKSFSAQLDRGTVQTSKTSKDVQGAIPVEIDSGELTVGSGGRARVPVSPAFRVEPNMVLELELKTTSLEQTPWQPPPTPPGPDLPAGALLDFQGIQLQNAPSRMPIPDYAAPEPPTVVEDMQVLSLESGGKTTPLPEVAISSQWRTLRIPLEELAGSVSGIVIENRNTYREISVRGIRIYDVTSRGDARPVNALTEATDAEISVDGVTITRDTNTISDLIPGVTLTLKSPGKESVHLAVAADTERIKNDLITFVGYYNQALTNIDVVTRTDDSVVTDAYFETEAAQEKARERVGLFSGDMTLTRLKNQLTTAMMNAYQTAAGQQMTLLAQLGIATSTASPGTSGIDKTRLRGYLEIDEAKLEAALRDQTKAVQQLFGMDTDGDLVVDSGVAFQIDNILRAYVGRGGIISTRTGTLDTQIAAKNTQIANEEDRLEDVEAALKKKYTAMEGALRSLEESSTRLQNFSDSGD